MVILRQVRSVSFFHTYFKIFFQLVCRLKQIQQQQLCQSVPYKVAYNYLEGYVRKILSLIIRNWFIIIYRVINLFRILELHGPNFKIILIGNCTIRTMRFYFQSQIYFSGMLAPKHNNHDHCEPWFTINFRLHSWKC